MFRSSRRSSTDEECLLTWRRMSNFHVSHVSPPFAGGLPSGPSGACRAGLETLEPRRLLASQPYVVTVTDDSTGAGTLRSAILAANQDTDPDPFDIVFNIPASTAPDLNVPVAGFDPVTQTWQITLNSPLPTITHAVSIDGFSAGEPSGSVPVFR